LIGLLDEDEFSRWLMMARRTLDSARGDLERDDYNWACFKSHQAAEYAVKALLRGVGETAHGHSVSNLVKKLSAVDFSEILEHAKALDKFYVPTRYPDAWPEGIPVDYYTEKDAVEALMSAEKILDWVVRVWKSLGGGESNGRR